MWYARYSRYGSAAILKKRESLTHDLSLTRKTIVAHQILGSLSSNVFERRTSTGSGLFSFFDGGFAQIFSQIASITVKKLRNTNFISSRHVKRENTSLPVDVRRSKTSLLKLPIVLVIIPFYTYHN